MRLGFILLLLLCTRAYSQPTQHVATHSGRIEIIPLDQLNSPFDEDNLCLTANSRQLYFSTNRGGQIWSYSRRGPGGWYASDRDIWVSEKVKGQWQPPVPLPYGINTSNSEDEPSTVKNGKVLYYQSWGLQWEQTQGPYYRVKRKGRKWKNLQGLGGPITRFFRLYSYTHGMCVSPDQRLLIVAARKPSEAHFDVYMSRKGPFGWSRFTRLDISTAGNEQSVFLAADGKTLYFASDGYEGFGGLDIYKTVLSADGSFGAIINLGAPINSEQDDYGFVISKDGNEAYFVRQGDIYMLGLSRADPLIKPLQ